MKGGIIKTNPGVNNPDIVRPVGDLDESVNVLRFDRVAGRMVRLENGPDTFDMRLSGLVIGPVAIIGIPSEPFFVIGA